jgi:hypothetical protein
MKYLLPGVSWATNATYPAGSFPWSGGPTKIEPSTGLQAGGAVPNAQVSAQELNWFLNNNQTGLAIQAHAAMRSWQPASHLLAGGTGKDIVAVRSLASTFVNAPNDRQRFVSVFGPNAGDSSDGYGTASADGVLWLSSGKVTGTGISSGFVYSPTTNFAVAGDAGVVIIGDASTLVVSTDGGVTWATNTNYTNLNTLGMHWAPFSGGTYVSVDTDGIVRIGTSLGASTNAAHPATTFGSLASGNYADFADDGNGTIVFVCRANSNTFFSAFTSTDSGATWTKTQDLAGTHANVTYNKALGVWCLFDDTGLFYTSGIGSAWNSIATGIVPGSTFVGRARMASAGPAIAIPYGITGLWRGVVYTLDLGNTWNTWAFTSANGINALRGINGRLFALADDKIWQSGQLAAPDADLIA